jgi:hypothetical protein
VNVPASFQLLLAGHDTVQCAYFLAAQRGSEIDFERLGVLKEGLRQSKSRNPMVIPLGGREFLLQPYGSGSGYPCVISNPDCTIEFGEFNHPSFFVTFRSEALWREGAKALHERFLAWAASLGLMPVKPEALSRVDFTFDYQLPALDFNEDAFVSLSAKESRYREDGKLQTVSFGKGDVVLRFYDKIAEIEQQSEKVWLFDLWGRASDVWRIEWQTRKDILRRFGIRTFADLYDSQGDLLRYLAHEHDTLRVPTPDSNRSRWPLHPLWLDLQAQVETLNAQGVYREIDPGAAMNERLMRIAVSVYGYLKRVAAIQRLQHAEDFVSHPQALERLQSLLERVHDPLTWRTDIDKRVDQMRLGQW